MEINSVLISDKDNVVVVIEEVKAGDSVKPGQGIEVKANEDIMRNHKVAIKDVAAGSSVIKYGESIGLASKDIAAGDWVHTHNIEAEERGN